MARSTELREEFIAMTKVEALFKQLDELADPAMRKRVLRYAAEMASDATAGLFAPEAVADPPADAAE